MLGIISFAGAFDVAINRFDGGVDIDVNERVGIANLPPNALPQQGHEFDQGVGLIDTAVSQPPPEGGYGGQLRYR